MPSTYSPDLRIELIGTGDQSGTWGITTNANLGTIIEDAISGLASVSVTSANQALTALNGAADQSRCAAISLTTTTGAPFNVYVPPVTKLYVISNASGQTATVFCSTVLGNTTAAGTGVAIPTGKSVLLRSTGVNIVEQLNHVTGNLSVGGTASATAFSGPLTGNVTGNAATATTITGTNTSFGLSVSAQNTGSAAKAGPEVTGQGGGGAVWSMHRPGVFGLNIGLDSDNVFRIGGWSASANRLQMDMSGNLTMAGNVTAFSDARLKTNVQTISNALDMVGRMRGVSYTKDGSAGVGVIAQELREVLPEVVHESGEYLSVAYGNIVGVLIEAVKELRTEIDALKRGN